MSAPRRRDGVASRDVDGDAVLWDGDSLHLLDQGAAAVWHLLDGRHTQLDISRALAKQFAADPAQLTADVTWLLEWFSIRGLLDDVRQDEGLLPK